MVEVLLRRKRLHISLHSQVLCTNLRPVRLNQALPNPIGGISIKNPATKSLQFASKTCHGTFLLIRVCAQANSRSSLFRQAHRAANNLARRTSGGFLYSFRSIRDLQQRYSYDQGPVLVQHERGRIDPVAAGKGQTVVSRLLQSAIPTTRLSCLPTVS